MMEERVPRRTGKSATKRRMYVKDVPQESDEQRRVCELGRRQRFVTGSLLTESRQKNSGSQGMKLQKTKRTNVGQEEWKNAEERGRVKSLPRSPATATPAAPVGGSRIVAAGRAVPNEDTKRGTWKPREKAGTNSELVQFIICSLYDFTIIYFALSSTS